MLELNKTHLKRKLDHFRVSEENIYENKTQQLITFCIEWSQIIMTAPWVNESKVGKPMVNLGRHGIQPNDTQHNNTQHNNTHIMTVT